MCTLKLLLVLVFVSAVSPVATAAELTAPSEIEIVTAVIPPYSYLENDKPKGLIIEIIEAMAKHTGHSAKIKFLPWKRALQETTEATATPKMIIPLNRSDERELKFTWIQELYVDDTVFATKKGVTPKFTKPEDAMNIKTGVLLGSPLEAQLRRMGLKNIEAAVDEETNARKLNAGRIQAWHVARLVAPFVFQRHNFSPDDLEYGGSLEPNDLYLAGSKNFPENIAVAWREAFKKIKADGTLESIVKRYHH